MPWLIAPSQPADKAPNKSNTATLQKTIIKNGIVFVLGIKDCRLKK